MYSGKDDTKFVRKRADGGEFEFSDTGGQFIVIARMGDAGANFKPVLHLGLMPVVEQGRAEMLSSYLESIMIDEISTQENGEIRAGSWQVTSARVGLK